MLLVCTQAYAARSSSGSEEEQSREAPQAIPEHLWGNPPCVMPRLMKKYDVENIALPP